MNLFEGIPEDVIEKTLLNIERNLSNVGIYGGHTIRKHTNISDEILLNRISEEQIFAATSYYSKNIAEKAVALTMKSNFSIIKSWLLSAVVTDLPLKASFKSNIGYGFKKGNPNKLFSKTANIVLVKDEKADWGFRIKTAYLLI